MHAPVRAVPPRYNNYHGPKAGILGNPANHVPPAWRPNNAGPNAQPGGRPPTGPAAKAQVQPGSRILISNLPMDVSEKEVEELFQKTVGPLKDVLLVYNSQGRSKGVAVVSFQRTADAAVARSKYHNKIVDGKRPIKIEIVVDGIPSSSAAQPATQAPMQPRSLLQRLGGAALTGPVLPAARTAPRPRPVVANTNNATRVVMPVRKRVKKGARRVNKRLAPKTVADLDKEMDDYRAAAEA